MQYRVPRGTFDSLPVEPRPQDLWKSSNRWHYLEKTIRDLAFDYCFAEIRTPVFEQTDLFVRSIGETSDILSKEMYIFADKGGRSVALRPEGTAPVMRSVMENRLDMLEGSQKLFYIGPFFRHDRPQTGRFRQFHQFGVEAVGDLSPEKDFETIDMLLELYNRLGLSNVKVLLNSLGEEGTRVRYKEKLCAFLRPHLADLSCESRERFEKNPLRILDSKDKEEQKLLTEAPVIIDMLDPESKEHFDEVCTLLTKGGIAFDITPSLVRGLDYYNRTVFEVVSNVLGAQNALGGGGRYDGLSSSLGGPSIPAVGFATGMERILQTMVKQECSFPDSPGVKVFFVFLGVPAHKELLSSLYALRHMRIGSDGILCSKIQKGLQAANRARAEYVVIAGERELDRGIVQVKHMHTGKITEIDPKTLTLFFTET